MKNIETIFSVLFAAMILTIAAPNVMASHHKGSDPTNTQDKGTTPSGDKKGTTDTGGQIPDTTQGQTPGTTGQTGPGPCNGGDCAYTGPTPQTTPPPTPGPTFKGPTQIQDCSAAGIVALNQCEQVMNIKNVHSTTV